MYKRQIVVINKVDKPTARVEKVLDEVIDLFIELGATEEQLDFKVAYVSALNGTACLLYTSFSSSFDGSNLSKEDIDYIKLAAYYGYNYPGHESDNYYLATQDIIWKRLSNVSVKYIRNMNPNNYIDVSKEKEDILLLMSKHNIKPSFYGSEINIIRGREYVLAVSYTHLDVYKRQANCY